MPPVVELQHVTVRYGARTALQDVTRELPHRGRGAARAQRRRQEHDDSCLLGFVPPTEGQMTVLGLDVAKSPLAVRSRIGYMPETTGTFPA
jgi:ABC-2 type transport system ATP-binding protein